MKYVHINVDRTDGSYISDYAIQGTDTLKALEKLLKMYPSFDDPACVFTTRIIDSDDEKYKEWFRVARLRGCVY